MSFPRLLLPLCLATLLAGCSGGGDADAPAAEAPAPAAPTAPRQDALTGPASPALIMVQAQFDTSGDSPRPGPARLTLWRQAEGGTWSSTVLEDPDSNVFHKAIAWRGGLLTIGAMGAKLKHWTWSEGGWQQNTLWERSWGGRFDRLRDLEIADVNGDGSEDLVIVTHDQGVVAVGTEVDGTWTFAEMDQRADTFIHEAEIGDVDGDGTLEFYVTPSDRNQGIGSSQPGGVARYDWQDGAWVRSSVVQWDDTHAKEILVADTDGDGRDELYAVAEGEREGRGASAQLTEPVRIIRFDRGGDGAWTPTVVAELQDAQCRFLLAGDVDHDGVTELVASGLSSGLWKLERGEDGHFTPSAIATDSSGYEHATHAADLDGDGRLELYVASDNEHELRQYTWDGSAWQRTTMGTIAPTEMTWNLQDGVF